MRYVRNLSLILPLGVGLLLAVWAGVPMAKAAGTCWSTRCAAAFQPQPCSLALKGFARCLWEQGRAVFSFAPVSGGGEESGMSGVRLIGPGDDLAVAVQNAPDGSTLRLAPGVYPATRVIGVARKRGIVLTSADPDDMAILTGLELHKSSGITLKKLHFNGMAPNANYGLLVMHCERIAVENSVFDNPQKLVDQRKMSAFMLRLTTDSTVSRNHFSYYKHGLEMLDVARVQVIGNEFEQMQTDGIRGGGINDALFAENVIADFHPLPGDHPDGIQLWTTHQTESAHNIIARDNLIYRGEGAVLQGIFMTDQSGGALPYKNVEITGNLAIGTMYNGIMVAGGDGVRITNNQVYGYPDMKSWVRTDKVVNTLISNNDATAYVIDKDSQVEQRDNAINMASDRHPGRRINAWLKDRPHMVANAGPLLRRLMAMRD